VCYSTRGTMLRWRTSKLREKGVLAKFFSFLKSCGSSSQHLLFFNRNSVGRLQVFFFIVELVDFFWAFLRLFVRIFLVFLFREMFF
jgi:hypothetical protein